MLSWETFTNQPLAVALPSFHERIPLVCTYMVCRNLEIREGFPDPTEEDPQNLPSYENK